MAGLTTIYLTYHEIRVPGRELRRNEAGYVHYVVEDSGFRAQLSRLKDLNLRGVSVSEALEAGASGVVVAGKPNLVVLTFDDGSETDLLAAAPLLSDCGFTATFYVVAGWLGGRGFLSPAGLRELSGLGFEIGCHSMTHAYLPDLSDSQLRTEVVTAKELLEQTLGRRVEHFACPGGRWSPRVAEAAGAAGYSSLATSRIGPNSPSSDPFRLNRVAVTRGVSLAEFDRLCRGRGLWSRRGQYAVLSVAKALLSDATYEKIRSSLLDGQ